MPTLKSVSIPGPAGVLEGLLEETREASRLRRAVIWCHPHPLYGGTMHNKVVYRMARAARAEGSTILRFNFRGVGVSDGTYDGGQGEQADLRAAIRFVRERHRGLPLVVGGFSFGARVSIHACCADQSVERVVAVGTPVDGGGFSFLEGCSRPIHFIHSTRDQFGSRESLERVLALAGDPCQVTWIDAKDHFFSDALDALESSVREAIR